MTNQISGNTNLSWYEKEALTNSSAIHPVNWDGNENWESIFYSSNTGIHAFSLDTAADWYLSGIDSDLFYLSNDSSNTIFFDSLQEEQSTNTKYVYLKPKMYSSSKGYYDRYYQYSGFDYENPIDHNKDNIYNITLTSSSSYGIEKNEISISIINFNEKINSDLETWGENERDKYIISTPYQESDPITYGYIGNGFFESPATTHRLVNINHPGDRDWYRLTLEPEAKYKLTVKALNGPYYDPFGWVPEMPSPLENINLKVTASSSNTVEISSNNGLLEMEIDNINSNSPKYYKFDIGSSDKQSIGWVVADLLVLTDGKSPEIKGRDFPLISEHELLVDTITSSHEVDWTINGNDSSKFTINKSSIFESNGQFSYDIKFIKSPDYENPIDYDKDNQYEISLLAESIYGNQSTHDITVNILDIEGKVYSSEFHNYTFINKGNNEYGIKLDSSSEVDSLTVVSKLDFADKLLDVTNDVIGVFDQVTGLNTDSGKMFRLYNAAFARFPDSDGLKYWINNFSSGVDDERAVSSSFLASAEFKERYGDNITHETYVQNLYLNVLNRELDEGGYDYWVGNLNNGIEQRHEVLLGFSESAENKLLFTEMTGFA